MMYKPPFTVSAVAINRIAEITRLIERYAIRLEQEDGLRLRKANRIRTIHSSLAIYDAIAASSNVGDSRPFIDFMLGELLVTLRNHQGKERSTECETSNVADELTDRQRVICDLIRSGVAINVAVNTKYLADKLGLNRKTVQREMATLVERRLVVWVGSDRTGHWEICND